MRILRVDVGLSWRFWILWALGRVFLQVVAGELLFLQPQGMQRCYILSPGYDHVRHVASLAQAAPLKKFGKSDVCDFFAEIDFRHGSRFRR